MLPTGLWNDESTLHYKIALVSEHESQFERLKISLKSEALK